MANWHKRGIYPDSDDEEETRKLGETQAEERKIAEMRAALNKAHKHYEHTKIHHNENINKIRAAARAFIAALKPYAGNRNNANTIKKIHELINSEYKSHPLNRNFLKNLKSNAKGLAAAEATRKKHNNNQNYLLYTS
jgi:lysozyme family protein